MDLLLLIALFVLFGLIIVSYSIKTLDFVAISIVCCFIAGTITGLVKGIGLEVIITFIDFKVIIIILAINIITKIAQDSNILEYLAIKLFKISKGNQRTFFYLLCLISTILAAIVVNDFVVMIILAPVVIRLCRYLRIEAGTFLLGMTVCVNLAGLISPISGSDMIVISSAFNLNVFYFVQYYWIFSFFLIFLTMYLIDRILLRKEPKIEENQGNIVLDLIDTDILIKNKKMFYFNSVAIIITTVLIVVLPLLYLTVAFSALILSLVNKKFTKTPMSTLLRDVEWEMIFFFISLYVVVGCILQAGFREIFEIIDFTSFNSLLVALIFLIIVTILAGVIINAPIALIFIPIVGTLISVEGFPPVLMLYVLIFGFNIGDNLIPQGSASNMVTLKIAQDNGVKNFTYKRMLKVGMSLMIIHLLLSILYLFFLSLVFT